MPTHKSYNQRALIALGTAISRLYGALYASGDAYTRDDAKLISAALRRPDRDELLNEAIAHTGRQDSGLRELELFVDDELQQDGFDPFESLPGAERRLTPAEFKCLRASLGLTTKWLADRWDVAEFSVKRWERARMLPEDAERRLTPAEFKCLRASLGLTTKWLADRWDVAEFSVKRWERARMLPEEFSEDMLGLRRRFLDEVAQGKACVADSISVPRTDRDTDLGFPAAWWQLIAWRVHEDTGQMILFYDDFTEDLEPEPDDLDGDGDE